MESGEATKEQAAAAANQAREKERRTVVQQRAKQAPTLVRGPVNLPGRKRPRVEAPTAAVESPSSRRPGGGGSETRPSPSPQQETGAHPTSSTSGGAQPLEQSPVTEREIGGFFQAGHTDRMTLLRRTVEAWDLLPAGLSGPPSVSSDDMIFAEAFARGIRFNAERRRLEGALSRHKIRVEQLKKERGELSLKLEEAEEKIEPLKKERDELSLKLEKAEERARSEAAAAAERVAKAEERAERRGQRRAAAEAREFLRKALILVAPDFQDDEYFEAFVKYVEERERVAAVGGNPDAVEFPYVAPESPQEDNPPEAAPEDDVPSTLAADATEVMPPPP